jgi:hypothetical protein
MDMISVKSSWLHISRKNRAPLFCILPESYLKPSTWICSAPHIWCELQSAHCSSVSISADI